MNPLGQQKLDENTLPRTVFVTNEENDCSVGYKKSKCNLLHNYLDTRTKLVTKASHRGTSDLDLAP